jgi:hypothetical protein
MLIVALGWMFVVLLMTLAEATSPDGTLLGALITFVLYGVLPVSIVLYVMATPMRRRRRHSRRPSKRRRPSASSANPDRRRVATSDAVAPEREEQRRIAVSAPWPPGDGAHPRPLKAPPRQRGQIGPPLAWGRAGAEVRRRVGAESLAHIGADLEGLRADARTQPGAHLGRGALGRFAQGGQRGLEHTTRQAPPAGMGRRHAAPARRRQQHRQQSAPHGAGHAAVGEAASAWRNGRPGARSACVSRTTCVPCTW